MEPEVRKRTVVRAIVELYIRTGEPVGSKAVVDAIGQTVSSATIRNDMAELSAQGYLDQPHTSAGRVPTSKAFRLYIDHLMTKHPLPEEEKRVIDDTLSAVSREPERLMEEASFLLAQDTGYAAVAATPDRQGACVKQVEIMATSARSVAVLLMTDAGNLLSRVCRLSDDCDAEALQTIAKHLNEAFAGQPLSSIGVSRIQRLIAYLPSLVYTPILTAFSALSREAAQAQIRLSGQLNLLKHPDYQPERARDLLAFLSRREQLATVLTAPAGDACVLLGGESLRPELDGTSIIVARYFAGTPRAGSLGLIGPLRMNYETAIPRLEYVAQTIGRLLEE